jgi:hypothetical protein
MYRIGYFFGLLALILAALLAWCIVSGKERAWGYQIEIDRNSGLIRRTDFRFFHIASRRTQTNSVAELAAKIQTPFGAQWELAVRRPIFRGEVIEIDAAKLLNADTMLGMILTSSDMDPDKRSGLVKEFLARMKTNAPNDVETWVLAQSAILTQGQLYTNAPGQR